MSNKDPDFETYFKQNMEALGLPTPSSLFSSLTTATSTLATIEAAIMRFGPQVTVTELIGAGVLSEKFAAVGALSASYYAGAVVGSLAVATGKILADSGMAEPIFTFWGRLFQANDGIERVKLENLWGDYETLEPDGGTVSPRPLDAVPDELGLVQLVGIPAPEVTF